MNPRWIRDVSVKIGYFCILCFFFGSLSSLCEGRERASIIPVSRLKTATHKSVVKGQTLPQAVISFDFMVLIVICCYSTLWSCLYHLLCGLWTFYLAGESLYHSSYSPVHTQNSSEPCREGYVPKHSKGTFSGVDT